MVNKVILLGRAGKDPEIRHIDNNMSVARFPLATSEYWTKDGNRTEHTEWHNIVAWRGLSDLAGKYIRKGSTLYVEGRLRTRSYDDKDGIKRYATEILADVIQITGLRPEGTQSTAQSPSAQQAPSLPPIETTNLESAPDNLPF
jgi:single-strand DNA-binding protein